MRQIRYLTCRMETYELDGETFAKDPEVEEDETREYSEFDAAEIAQDLADHGCTETSSWPYSVGDWYMGVSSPDTHDGHEMEFTAHLSGFSEVEELAIHRQFAHPERWNQ